MVSVFGTSLSSGSGSVDLTSYAKKTDLTAIARSGEELRTDVTALQGKIPEIEWTVESVKKSEGPKGDRGEQGDRGETGPKGDKGEQGPRGERGERGPQGERGLRGLKGNKGDKGEKGERGQTGAAGPKGEQGTPGKTGPRGDNNLIPHTIKRNITRLAGSYRTSIEFPEGKTILNNKILVQSVQVKIRAEPSEGGGMWVDVSRLGDISHYISSDGSQLVWTFESNISHLYPDGDNFLVQYLEIA